MANLASMARSTYGQLQTAFAHANSFEHTVNMLRWDSMTKLPKGAGRIRTAVIAEMESALHAGLRDPNIPRLIAQARVEIHQQQRNALENGNRPANVGDLVASLREMERVVRKAHAVDPDLIKRKSERTGDAANAWRGARETNNWLAFEPHLSKVLECVVEEGKQLANDATRQSNVPSLSTYDALLDKYEPGVKSELVDHVFGGLLEWLPAAAKYTAERDERRSKESPPAQLVGPFALVKQRELALEVMSIFGFNTGQGRLDEAAHPFCGGVPQDTRLATRFNLNNVLEGLYAVIHEVGHGRYEQGLPSRHATLPVGKARSMGIHESQSLLCEMQIGRRDSFLQWLSPRLIDIFGHQKAFEPDQLRTLVRTVRRGKIRVFADELTYPLHVALRYEIEKMLVGGALKVKDVPAHWKHQMKELLDVDVADNEHGSGGCLQDIHWAMGLFGYFPTYVLGAAYAAQQVRALTSDLGGRDTVDGMIRQGNHVQIVQWLRERVWSRGSELPTAALIMSATGEALNPEHYKQHLLETYAR